MKRAVSRRVDTLTNAFESVLRVGSKPNTNGYITYPSVARNLCAEHRVVNNSASSVDEDGKHTNNIEWFWAHLKSTIEREMARRDVIFNIC